MRHLTLTCRNHPQLRWSCKSIAWTPGEGYNGSRNIFFQGEAKLDSEGLPKRYSDGSGTDCSPATECACPPSYLCLAVEDPWAGLSQSDLAEAIALD